MKIYVASSWRNPFHQGFVDSLREAGHDVYNFKNPPGNKEAFHWKEVDPNWRDWNAVQLRAALSSPEAEAGYQADIDALNWCEACVLLLPAGNSSHLELGWASGRGKRTIVLLSGQDEPELMYKMATHICSTFLEVLEALKT
jgi:hypothetical protein